MNNIIVSKLVSKATKSIDDDTFSDEILLKIKLLCKSSREAAQELAYYLVIDASTSKSILIRLNAFHIIGILFDKSKDFRTSICQNLKKLLHSVNIPTSEKFNHNFNTTEIKLLKNRLIRLIFLWDNKFGGFYSSLHAVSRYLLESLKIDPVEINTAINTSFDSISRSVLNDYNSAVLSLKHHIHVIQSCIKSYSKCMNVYTQSKEVRRHIVVAQDSILLSNNSIQSEYNPTTSLRNLDTALSANRIKNDDLEYYQENPRVGLKVGDSDNIVRNEIDRYHINDNESDDYDDIDWVSDNEDLIIEDYSHINSKRVKLSLDESESSNSMLFREKVSLDIGSLNNTLNEFKLHFRDNIFSLVKSWENAFSEFISNAQGKSRYEIRLKAANKLLKVVKSYNIVIQNILNDSLDD